MKTNSPAQKHSKRGNLKLLERFFFFQPRQTLHLDQPSESADFFEGQQNTESWSSQISLLLLFIIVKNVCKM